MGKNKVGPNQSCPCGSLGANGKPRKYKRCCGSCAGDLVYFVANAEGRALENAQGHIMVFKDRAVAAACAFQAGWAEGSAEIVPLTPQRYTAFAAQLPTVLITVKDFDISKELPKVTPTPAEPEAPKVIMPPTKFTFL